jgi:hypothetical protein
VVSQSTNGDVEDDINMILSCTSVLSFDLIQVRVVRTVKHLTFMNVFVGQNVTAVGILCGRMLQLLAFCMSYRERRVWERGEFLKGFLYLSIIYPQDQL